MSTRTHIHEEAFDTSPEQLFALLHTPSAICRWWSAGKAIVLAEEGGVWAATWGSDEDDPDYTTLATISVFEPPSRLVLSDYRYRTREGGLPFEANFRCEFTVTPATGGASLKVIQDGFPTGPEGDEFLAGCEKGWRDTFQGIRRYLAAL